MSKSTLDRILQAQGFGARKWCRNLIAEGEVNIAGETVTDRALPDSSARLRAGFVLLLVILAAFALANTASAKPPSDDDCLACHADNGPWKDGADLIIDIIDKTTGQSLKQPNGDFSYKGATVGDVELMRKHSGPKVQVKCAGGVRTLDDLLKMKAAGATRSGATATEVILDEAKKRFGHE